MKIGLVNPILYIIYLFAKVVTKVSMRMYYSEIKVVGRQRARIKHGHVLASNHPNALIDPLNVAKLSPKVVHFLANAGLYKSKIGNFIFSTFYCIRVERKEDVGNRKLNNSDAFLKSYEFLKDGGCLFIAPEGASWNNRILHPLKTGMARILLKTAEMYKLKKDLCVLPVGLDYSAFGKFRANLLIQVGEPIYMDSYMEQYKEKPKAAILRLVEDVNLQLQKLTLNSETEKGEANLNFMETILQSENRLNIVSNFERNKKVLHTLQTDNEATGFTEQLLDYKNKLYSEGLNPQALSSRTTIWTTLSNTVLGILLIPLFIISSLIVGPFLKGIDWIVAKYSPHKEYLTTGHIVLAMVLFPVYILLYSFILWGLGLEKLPIIVICFAFLPLLVVWKEVFLKFRQIIMSWKGLYFCHKNPEKAKNFTQIRNTLIRHVENH